MIKPGAVSTLFLAAVLALASTPATAGNASQTAPEEIAARQTKQATKAQIYFLRGGFGGAYSHGLDKIAATLGGKGIKAQVLSWSSSGSVVARIKKAYAADRQSGPVILAGHSLGAGAVIDVAKQLTAAGIRVDLLIVFDTLGAPPVPKGVDRFYSFKASGDKESEGSFKGGPGFSGKITNVDIRRLPGMENSSHWNMLDMKDLQGRIVREVETTVRRYKPRRAAG